jgi:hypothetical protein
MKAFFRQKDRYENAQNLDFIEKKHLKMSILVPKYHAKCMLESDPAVLTFILILTGLLGPFLSSRLQSPFLTFSNCLLKSKQRFKCLQPINVSNKTSSTG